MNWSLTFDRVSDATAVEKTFFIQANTRFVHGQQNIILMVNYVRRVRVTAIVDNDHDSDAGNGMVTQNKCGLNSV